MFQPIAMTLGMCFPEFIAGDISKLPKVSVLNKKFDFINHNQKSLKFVNQDQNMAHQALGYEERIYQYGLIATRSNNWHDFFNAMVWMNFPKIKIAINAIHQQEIATQKNTRRSRKRDLLTLVDECGVIIIANDHILKLIRQHQWQELFVTNRDLWLTGQIQIITIGHAMFEKYQQPYIGMTAQALLLKGEITNIDSHVAKGLMNQTLLNSKTDLSPLPVLGVPAWYEKQDQEFYANLNYFRPLKKHSKTTL